MVVASTILAFLIALTLPLAWYWQILMVLPLDLVICTALGWFARKAPPLL